ncbi:MAG: HAD family hydrolase [Bdellovibrionales bacterium]|nr:HAD family hydrolase [Bdellovibrionales bacterium]
MSIREQIDSFSGRLETGQVVEAIGELSSLCQLELSVSDLQKLERQIFKHEEILRNSDAIKSVRFAILGGYTTQPIELALRVFLLSEGVLPTLYVSDYDTYKMEVLNEASGLYQFNAEFVLFATGLRNLNEYPDAFESAEEVERLAEQAVGELASLWEKLVVKAGAKIVQHDFEKPRDGGLGRLERSVHWSRSSFVELVNEKLWSRAEGDVQILSVADLASQVGYESWFEPKWYYHSKHGFSPRHASRYARAFVGLYRAFSGGSKKCLVVDLDNTLWGGVIGDDGLAGIRLGPESAEGEAYYDFCCYLKRLRARGVILAVNSKNEPKIAEEVFTSHPAMPLDLSDFSVFCCNWADKGGNLSQIADELNIGLDSLVMVDDNPVECAQIRDSVPKVAVVELGSDPAEFIRLIERRHFFDQMSVTEEDSARAASYYATRKVKEANASGADLGEFLSSLVMSAEIRPAVTDDLPRLEQLMLKTNQFNLTTKRYLSQDLRGFMQDADRFCLTVTLKDKFSFYGIISSVVGRFEGNALVIDNWVMSCRVFSRTLEEAIFNYIRALAGSKACERINAEFVQTERNGVVPPVLARLGFAAAGESLWECNYESSKELETHIKLNS